MYEIKQYLQSRDDVYSIINGIESGLKEQLVSGLILKKYVYGHDSRSYS